MKVDQHILPVWVSTWVLRWWLAVNALPQLSTKHLWKRWIESLSKMNNISLWAIDTILYQILTLRKHSIGLSKTIWNWNNLQSKVAELHVATLLWTVCICTCTSWKSKWEPMSVVPCLTHTKGLVSCALGAGCCLVRKQTNTESWTKTASWQTVRLSFRF